MNKHEKATLSVKEMMDCLGISRSTAYELVAKEGFPSFRIGKKILINRESLSEWLKEQSEQSKENFSSFA